MVIKFLRRLKEAHYGFLTLKNLKILKKAGMHVNNYKFAKDSLIPATLFKFNNAWENHWKPLFA